MNSKNQDKQTVKFIARVLFIGGMVLMLLSVVLRDVDMFTGGTICLLLAVSYTLLTETEGMEMCKFTK